MVTFGVKAPDYAQHLLDIAQAVSRKQRALMSSMQMASTPRVESRIQRILAVGLSRNVVSTSGRRQIFAAAAAAALALASVRLTTAAVSLPSLVSNDHNRVIVESRTLGNGAVVTLFRPYGGGKIPDGVPVPQPTKRFGEHNGSIINTGSGNGPLRSEINFDTSLQPATLWRKSPDDPYRWINSSKSGKSNIYYARPTDWIGMPVTQKNGLYYGVAAGPWTQRVDCLMREGKTYIKTSSGEVIFTLIRNPHHLTDPTKVAAGNAVLMASDHFESLQRTADEISPYPANFETRLIGLDRDGHAVQAFSVTNDWGPVSFQDSSLKSEHRANVRNADLKGIVTLELVGRPYHWARFPASAIIVAKKSRN